MPILLKKDVVVQVSFDYVPCAASEQKTNCTPQGRPKWCANLAACSSLSALAAQGGGGGAGGRTMGAIVLELGAILVGLRKAGGAVCAVAEWRKAPPLAAKMATDRTS